MQTLIDFFGNKNFIPHGYCLSWSPLLLWLHVVSDLVITLSYYFIPFSLAYFVRQRKDMPYRWLIILTALFIVACGTTHLISVVTIWLPLYWLDAYVKVFTALISLVTAVFMLRIIPLALQLPTTGQLQREIAERLQAQLAQQEALARLEKIASRIPGMVYQFRLNADGSSCFPYASAAIQDIYHVSPDDVRKTAAKIFELIHPDDYTQIAVSIEISARNLTPWRHEYRIRFADGSEHWLLGNALPQREQDGSVLWHGFVTDISERKQLEAELLKSRDELLRYFEQPFIGMLTADYAKHTINVNQCFCDMVGYSKEEMQTIDWGKLTHPDDIATNQTYLDRAKRGEIDSYQMGKRYIHKDGHIVYTELAVNCVRNIKGNLNYTVGMTLDVTARKQMENALKASETFTIGILNSLTEHIVVLNEQGVIVMVNQAWQQFASQNGLPQSQQNTIGYNYLNVCTKAYECSGDAEAEKIQRGIAAVLTGSQNSFYAEYLCQSNEPHWFQITVLPLKGAERGVVISHEDITERKQAETELRIAATAFESQEAMVITDANSVILRINAAFTKTTGYSAEDAIGQKMNLLRSGRHNDTFYDAMWESINTKGSWQGEIWDRRKNGEVYPKWLTITAVVGKDGKVSHYVGAHTDITARKATEEYINRLAFYDPLTHLPNRRLLHERLKHGIDVSHRTGKQMAVLLLDLDKFKAVNDNSGHAAGDDLLRQVAGRITAYLRETDMVARLGGDEFVILIEDVEHYESVARIAEEIIRLLSQPFTLSESHEAYIGASIGISIYPQHGNNIEALMDNADAALYHAKDSGRGRFAYFSEELTQKARERIALEARLRRAIEQGELRVYFQPQIAVDSGKIVGAEALVRWYDTDKGCLMPTDFIPLAEETGLIVGIGEWVLRETCKLGQQWLAQGLPVITLAVNVSPYQFRRCDINALVAQVLRETGFPAEYLELEITETGLMDNQEHALAILNKLHEQGVRLAIDDFGTGYSSLAYLKYFPVDVLKIDKTFIDDIPHLQSDMAITATIIAMADHLGFKVLAEGVETAEQLVFLELHGCDMYQGYLYSKAIPASDFAALLANASQDHYI